MRFGGWLALWGVLACTAWAAPTWLRGPSAPVAHRGATTVQLSDGRILVLGGVGADAGLAHVSVFDPLTLRWSAGPSLPVPRDRVTATLLPSGQVFVAGGGGAPRSTLYLDPQTLGATPGPALQNFRFDHNTLLLDDGRALVAAGAATQISEVLQLDGSLSVGSSLQVGGTSTCLIALPTGGALLAGGFISSNVYTDATERFANNVWSVQRPMLEDRINGAFVLLPNGSALYAGGVTSAGTIARRADVFDPVANNWRALPVMTDRRADFAALRMTDGQVLVAGGLSTGAGLLSVLTELFTPSTERWLDAGVLFEGRRAHTLMLLPDGRPMVVGGLNQIEVVTASTEVLSLYTDFTRTQSAPLTPRHEAVAVLLPDDTVLVVGSSATGDIVRVDGGAHVSTSPQATPRLSGSTASLLFDGRVLISGGLNASGALVASVELYNSATGAFVTGPSMLTPRFSHTSTVLADGRVLLCGGQSAASILATCELYDPAAGSMVATGAMTGARAVHSAVLLANGHVLVAGGRGLSSELASAERYDPGVGTWSAAGSMPDARSHFAAVLLPGGEVLVVGGHSPSPLASAATYDGATNGWSATLPLNVARRAPGAAVLASGRVLVAGGANSGGPVSTVEVFEPFTRSWSTVSTMGPSTLSPRVVALTDESVLALGGADAGAQLLRFQEHAGKVYQRQPTSTFPERVTAGGSISISGAGFLGGGDNHDGTPRTARSDFPLAQLRGVESGVTIFARTSNWSDVVTRALIPPGTVPGWYQARVIVGGAGSKAQLIFVQPQACVRDSQCGLYRCVSGACSGGLPLDAGTVDAGVPDAGTPDSGLVDAGALDAGTPDASVADAGVPDLGTNDSGLVDAGSIDAGVSVATLDAKIGCGCTSGSALGFLALVLLGLRGPSTRRQRGA